MGMGRWLERQMGERQEAILFQTRKGDRKEKGAESHNSEWKGFDVEGLAIDGMGFDASRREKWVRVKGRGKERKFPYNRGIKVFDFFSWFIPIRALGRCLSPCTV